MFEAIAGAFLTACVTLTGGYFCSQPIPPQTVEIKAEHPSSDAPQRTYKPQASEHPAEDPIKGCVAVAKALISAHGDQGEATGQSNHPANEAAEFCTISDIKFKISDLLLVALTGLLTVATILLAWATFSLVWGADKSSERQLVAYLGVRGAGVEFDSLSNPPHFVTITIRNDGKTPARNVRAWFSSRIVSAPAARNLGEAAEWPRDLPVNWVMTPETVMHLTEQISISPADLVAIQATGTKELIAWGKVAYGDVFGGENTVTFRYSMRRGLKAGRQWDGYADGVENRSERIAAPGWFCLLRRYRWMRMRRANRQIPRSIIGP